jgi:hypothetical protein
MRSIMVEIRVGLPERPNILYETNPIEEVMKYGRFYELC